MFIIKFNIKQNLLCVMPWYSPLNGKVQFGNENRKYVQIHQCSPGKKDGHPLPYEQDWKGNSEPKGGCHPGWY